MTEYKTYLCRYFYDDTWWAFSIKATDLADAWHRIDNWKNMNIVDGELE